MVFPTGQATRINSAGRNADTWNMSCMQAAILRQMKSLAILLLSALPCVASINQERLADAIWLAEGGAQSKSPYGILSVPVHDPIEARAICIRTIRHAILDFHGRSDKAFIRWFSLKYCPPSVDCIGNRHWKRNVIWFYSKDLMATRKYIK